MAKKKKQNVHTIIINKKILIILLIIVLLVAVGYLAFYFISQNSKPSTSSSASSSHSSHVSSYSAVEADKVEIHFLELGNKYTGDCTYIKAGETDILIDAGSRQNSAATIKEYLSDYVTDNKLEYVIATHAHQDHIAGFVGSSSISGIFETYKIDTLIDFPKTNSKTEIYNSYISKRDTQINAKNITNHYNALECYKEINGAKKSYTIGNNISLDILYQTYYENKTSDENDYSVCLMINQKDNHYLFTGDLEANGEASLVDSNVLPKVQLFKGGHHGSYTANTDKLLNVIKPETVCICCCAGSDEYTSIDENTFPAQASINRIAKHTDAIYVTTLVKDGAPYYQSMNGNIKFICPSGSTYTVTGSVNSTKLKETDWFKAHRTWPI